MSGAGSKPCVYSIPAGVSFVDCLADGLLQESGGDPAELARMQVLLPTRRAGRSLREAFLRLSGGKPLLLPRMIPLGDMDEEELSILTAGMGEDLSLPPALDPVQRQFLLVRLIRARGKSRSLEQDLALADALARLMDQVYTEDLDFSRLPDIVDKSLFAEHWQISLDFLSLVSHYWPDILREHGVIDSADKRNRLLKQQAELWEKSPPTHRIIAAGSTGSIRSSARLLYEISRAPRGSVILPGLDTHMDEHSWMQIGDTHPQATLSNLLKILGIERRDVLIWPAYKPDNKNQVRVFSTEIMRPAETADAWKNLDPASAPSRNDISIQRYDCANPQEEAFVIAYALRGALERTGRNGLPMTAALVTPDRALARRVAMACRRWNIEIDDSAGTPLPETPKGIFFLLALETLCAELKPVSLLDFCRHDLCQPIDKMEWRQKTAALDKHLLRGPAFEGGIEAYRKKIANLEQQGSKAGFTDTIDLIARGFEPFIRQGKTASLDSWIRAHLSVMEFFCPAEILWQGQDGESAALFFSSLLERAAFEEPLDAKDYTGLLRQLMAKVAVRPAYGRHPRLSILGQLEARLVEADLMILGGLNEGTWPRQATPDPWMSRPMRENFGLPSAERSIGLSAHDFAQAMCADHVILTRSMKMDGTPTVPSRWLQRMDTVLNGYGLTSQDFLRGTLLKEIRLLDMGREPKPVTRPAPKPPVSVRPKKISVTKIETWMNDPYSIYAREILGLKPLKPLEEEFSVAMRGTILHAIMETFARQFASTPKKDRHALFMRIAGAEMEKASLQKTEKAFWEPRLEKIAAWICAQEERWRQNFIPRIYEGKGVMMIQTACGEFSISGIADRIDVSKDGQRIAIIDYKSGGSFTASGIKTGRLPQLPIEAIMAEKGAFGEEVALPAETISYWCLTGGNDGAKEVSLNKRMEIDSVKEQSLSSLISLIETFGKEETPYYSLPRPDRKPAYNDYEHLARIKEWIALDDMEEDTE